LTESTSPGRLAWVITGVVVLIGMFWLQLALSVHRNSFTWDEDDHIYSGYMSWKHGDFGLNPEHPPLVKLVATLPLLHLPVKMPALQNRFFRLEGFLGGKEFFFNNDADGMLFRALLAVSFFAVPLALLVRITICQGGRARISARPGHHPGRKPGQKISASQIRFPAAL
jgi:hypothetical protein